jgi:hypothetical protein
MLWYVAVTTRREPRKHRYYSAYLTCAESAEEAKVNAEEEYLYEYEGLSIETVEAWPVERPAVWVGMKPGTVKDEWIRAALGPHPSAAETLAARVADLESDIEMLREEIEKAADPQTRESLQEDLEKTAKMLGELKTPTEFPNRPALGFTPIAAVELITRDEAARPGSRGGRCRAVSRYLRSLYLGSGDDRGGLFLTVKASAARPVLRVKPSAAEGRGLEPARPRCVKMTETVSPPEIEGETG